MPEEDYADGYVPAASILPNGDIEKDVRSRLSNLARKWLSNAAWHRPARWVGEDCIIPTLFLLNERGAGINAMER